KISQVLERFDQQIQRSEIAEGEQFHPTENDSVVVSRFDTRSLDVGEYLLRVEIENPLGDRPITRDLTFTVLE
ncbi:MAG TPA: hypothetical protein VGB99_03825, partial [Acidobacteriota bacterium]